LNIFSVITLIVIVFLLYFVFSTSKGEAVAYTPAKKQLSLPVSSSAEDIESYLQNSEVKYDDIKPDTEKKIQWFHNNKSKTDISIVYLHGFSATRKEVSPLTENIAQKLGANVFFTRLTGHGRSDSAMAEVSVENLLADALEAFEIGKKIGNRVVIVGMSTGSTLATWLAAHPDLEGIAGVILLSPNYGLIDPKSEWLLKPAARFWLPIVEGRSYQFTPDNDQQAIFWTYKYPTVALIPMMELVNYVINLPLQNIRPPVLVLYSEEDKIVDVSKIKAVYEQIGSQSKQIAAIKDTQGSQHHVIAGDILSPLTTAVVEKHILSFLSNLKTSL